MNHARVRFVTFVMLLFATSAVWGHGPHDVAELVVVSPAYTTDQTVLAKILLTDHALFGRSTDGGRSWAEYSAPVRDKQLEALAMSPAFATDQTVFAATRDAGVWRSVDGGVQWQPVNVGLANLAVHAVALSPSYSEDGTLLAATEGGLFRSSDRGESWTSVVTGLSETNLTVVTFAPGDAQTLFAGGLVVHRSDDGGFSWVPLQTFRQAICAVTMSPEFLVDGVAAVAFGRLGNGVYTTTDGGASWLPSWNGLTDLFVNDIVIANDGTLVAVASDAGFFRADSPLGPWTLFNDGFEPLSSQSDDHYLSVAPSPAFGQDGTVFVASFEGMFKSTDRGETWVQEDLYHQRINRRLAPSPSFAQDGTMFLGNYGGGPVSWREGTVATAPPTLPGNPGGPLALGGSPASSMAGGAVGVAPGSAPIQQGWGSHGSVSSLWSSVMVVSPGFAADRMLFYAYVGLWRSSNAGASWTKLQSPVLIPRGLALSPRFDLDQTVLMGSQQQGVYLSSDAGDTWLELQGGLPATFQTSQVVFSPAFPTDPSLFIASATHGVWRSTDGGSTWTDSFSGPGFQNVRTLAASPDFVADGLLLAGTAGASLYRSDDRGNTWTAIGADLPSGADNIIESIAFSPQFAVDRTVYVVSLYDGVFRSTDGGQTFQPMNNGLPATAAARVIVTSPDFAQDDTLFVSTHSWVWRSTDRGASWQRLSGFIRADEEHPAVRVTGAWAVVGNLGSISGRVSVNATQGSSHTLEFLGSSVSWHALRDPESGLAEVYIDGVLATTVDLYSRASIAQVVFATEFGSADWHTIRIEVTGTQSASSAGAFVKTDGFAYDF